MGLEKMPHGTKPSLPRTSMLQTMLITALAAATLTGLISHFRAQPALPQPSRPQSDFLHLKPDGTFQIGIFTDMHLGEDQHTTWGPDQDTRTTQVMTSILSQEDMDLAVLNGDLVTGYNLFRHNATAYIDRVLAPLVAAGTPFASAYGNHDNEFNITHEQIYEREGLYSLSRTRRMVAGSNDEIGINYYLPVYASAESKQTDTPALLLWFFDSRSGQKYGQHDARGNEVPLETWVHADVVDWFKTTAAGLTSQHGPIQSVAFFHVCPSAARFAQKAALLDPARHPGIDEETACPQGSAPDWAADSSAGEDIPFMAALLEAKQDWGLQATFSGHDHGLSWCYNWDSTLPGMTLTGNGLNLCFGAVTGYGGYGTWLRGSRQIVLTPGAPIESYIRYEDGSINARVTLNETYGRDHYPVVPVRHSYLYSA